MGELQSALDALAADDVGSLPARGPLGTITDRHLLAEPEDGSIIGTAADPAGRPVLLVVPDRDENRAGGVITVHCESEPTSSVCTLGIRGS